MVTIRRTLRRELDRLAGEIGRTWDDDGDACVVLNERRELLLKLFTSHACWWRCVLALWA